MIVFIPNGQRLTLGGVQHTCTVILIQSIIQSLSPACYDNTVKASARYWTGRGVSVRTKPYGKLQVQKVQTHQAQMNVRNYSLEHTHTNTHTNTHTHTHTHTHFWEDEECQSWYAASYETKFFCEV